MPLCQQFPLWKMPIQWENGLGGFGGLKRIFFNFFCLKFVHCVKKIRLDPLNPPNPFSHCIAFFQSGNCCPYVFSKNLCLLCPYIFAKINSAQSAYCALDGCKSSAATKCGNRNPLREIGVILK
jgi:hypothetical protein